jgi:uroporphyrinogen-III synthase
MGLTLEEVATRLERVEQELARLQQLLASSGFGETPAQRGAHLLREAATNQAAISAATAQAFADMGITVEPIGAERVQQMMLASGVPAPGDTLSRGIIEMRDE